MNTFFFLIIIDLSTFLNRKVSDVFSSFPRTFFSIKFCNWLRRKAFLLWVKECHATKVIGESLKLLDFHDDLLMCFCSELFICITTRKYSFWRKSEQLCNKQSKLVLMPGLLEHLSKDMNCCQVWIYERCIHLSLWNSFLINQVC